MVDSGKLVEKLNAVVSFFTKMLVAGEVGMAMVHWRWIQPTEIWKVRSCNETVSIQNHYLGGDVFEKKNLFVSPWKKVPGYQLQIKKWNKKEKTQAI